MKRSRLSIAALAAPVLLLPAALFAQNVPTPKPAPPVSADEDAIFRYNSAVGLLKKGRDFERAVTLLRGLLEADPQNRSYHLALGCAYVCRAAVITDAAHRGFMYLADDQAKYKTWLAAWEAAQKDRNDPLYNQPAPKPPVLTTRDDGKPFTLTQEQATKDFFDFLAKAQTEWDEALALSKTPEERGDALYTQGWGRRIVRRDNIEGAYTRDRLRETDKRIPTEKAIAADFTEATKNNPKNARYWQSLGDAIRGERPEEREASELVPAIAAYQTSLKWDSANSILWYRIYQLTRETNPAMAETAMRHAAAADSENAFLSYRLAGALLSKTRYKSFDRPFNPEKIPETDAVILKRIHGAAETEENRRLAEEALTLIERGNKMSRCKSIVYTSCPPELLKPIWNFQSEYSNWYFESTEVSTLDALLQGYSKTMLQENNSAEAQRAADALIGFGHRQADEILKAASTEILDVIKLQNGINSVEWGCDLIKEISAATGDASGLAQAKADYAALRVQYRAFRKAQKDLSDSRYQSER